jgi:hypothetical protein
VAWQIDRYPLALRGERIQNRAPRAVASAESVDEEKRPALPIANLVHRRRARRLPEFVRDIYCLGPRRDPLASRGKIHFSQIGPGTGASYFFLRAAGCRISPVLSEPHRAE